MSSDPNEALFERLASEDPARLLSMIESGELRPTDMTFAAETAGRFLPTDAVKPLLMTLLRHSSAIVREGACYGLVRHLADDVRHALKALAETDASPGVRDAAQYVLDWG